ncbi:MAG TPA: S41 family peptidase [Gammaproteobacteria bacterium]|jgi:carboxyl-terminal processing protease|nr:S41 family peptidase [Gammaproteobacteria bacterium]HIF88078.1 S41 family peptidase [Gammaproteobacteria bacterium]HIL64102.1 S41 family peptidase [Porticoccaceae bacterium]HIN90568.1 S41 family peptidase [Porticoccaceae bacterium]
MTFFRSFRRSLPALAFAAALLAPLSAGAQDSPAPLPLDEVRMFTEALERIRLSYVEEIDDKTLLENAIRGMLAGLDPHSAYMADDDYDFLQESTTGEFGGLGVEVGRENGYIRVISPIDDSPADRAGIKAGDLIIQVDNKPLREMLPEEAAQMMRGEPGTDVTVTIAREGQEPFDLTITREVIALASVRSRILIPGYAYIRISQFRVNTGDDLEAEIEELFEKHGELSGIILDLRNNPGGVLQASVHVVDSFISEGRIVYTKGRLEDVGMEFSATRKNVAGDVPLVVLINNGSASASEIVAGALQDHGRAIIMGTRSFGKGSVQTVLPLAEKRAIKLTTSLYYTPSGRSIQAQGIEPDIIVDEAFVTRRSTRVTQYNESDLRGHLSNGNGEEEQSDDMAAALISAEEVLVNDYPLNEALNVLKGINAFKPPRAPRTSGSFAQREN